jgi:hypothetical protein
MRTNDARAFARKTTGAIERSGSGTPSCLAQLLKFLWLSLQPIGLSRQCAEQASGQLDDR